MKKQLGFTLIELVIVIIILGILAATAVPKFVDLKGDARGAALAGVKSSLEGAATLTYSRAAIQSLEKSTTATLDDGTRIAYGYPRARNGANYIDSFRDVTGLSDTDWRIVFVNDATATITDADVDASTTCQVVYTQATSVARPTVVVTDSDC